MTSLLQRARSLHLLLGLCLGAGLSGTSASAEPVYPGADWEKTSPQALGWKEDALETWVNHVFSPTHTTDALLVIHDGKIVIERYARGYLPEQRHVGWSLTKSIWTTVFALAEEKGYLSRKDPVTKFFPEKKGSVWEEVQLIHLLMMSSGVAADEGYQSSPFRSDIVAALYRTPHLGGKGSYRLKATRRVAPPGDLFVYSSGETNLLSAAMKKAMGEAYADFPYEQLFAPIGARSFVLEKDHEGVIVGSSYGYATPRDFARFGYLFLKDGVWKGKRIVPEEWMKRVQDPGSPFSTLGLNHRPMQQYSVGWWLNRPVPTAQLGKSIQSAPSDMYWAEGHEGQFIFVIPSLDLVVVRLGHDKGRNRLDPERFFRLLMAAIPESKKAMSGKNPGGKEP